MQYGSIVTQQISIATHYRYLETHRREQLRFSDQLRQKIQRTFQDKLSFMLLVSVTLSIIIKCLVTTFTIGMFIP